MNPGASTYQHQHNLSAPVVVDPKFPPTEEYSQNNYIPTGGEFFSGHLNHTQHHLQYGYHNHHQPTTNPYGSPNLPNGGYGYSNYYHHHQPLPSSHTTIHSHQLRPALSMHTEPQSLQCPSLQSQNLPPNVTNTSILQNLADIAPNVTQPNTSSADISTNVCSPASIGHTNQDSRGSPPGHSSNSLQELGIRLEDNGSDGQEEIDDENMESPLMDDDDDDDSENGDRVIYPWMKKIHVAGVGKSIL